MTCVISAHALRTIIICSCPYMLSVQPESNLLQWPLLDIHVHCQNIIQLCAGYCSMCALVLPSGTFFSNCCVPVKRLFSSHPLLHLSPSPPFPLLVSPSVQENASLTTELYSLEEQPAGYCRTYTRQRMPQKAPGERCGHAKLSVTTR